jgi:hypothetical protein
VREQLVDEAEHRAHPGEQQQPAEQPEVDVGLGELRQADHHVRGAGLCGVAVDHRGPDVRVLRDGLVGHEQPRDERVAQVAIGRAALIRHRGRRQLDDVRQLQRRRRARRRVLHRALAIHGRRGLTAEPVLRRQIEVEHRALGDRPRALASPDARAALRLDRLPHHHREQRDEHRPQAQAPPNQQPAEQVDEQRLDQRREHAAHQRHRSSSSEQTPEQR